MDILKRSSLKVKSILGLISLVLVLSSMSLFTYLLLRGYMNSLSKMIDVNIVANDLKFMAGKATEGLPYDIEQFSVRPTEENKEKILSTFKEIQAKLSLMETVIDSQESRIQFDLIRNMFQTFSENFQTLVEKLNAKAPFAEINALTSEIRDGSSLIVEAIQQLISIELKYDHELKTKLEKQADWNGYLTLLIILVVSVLGMILFYFYLLKKSILAPLGKMQDTMQKIADDASDIKLRVEVHNEDEIGKLAKYFNKMADTIQFHKEGLEQRVKDRTEELRTAQQSALENAHAAGMAEISTSILHNIGNLVNSVNISADEVKKIINEAKIDELNKANLLLKEQIPSLPQFFTSDPRSKALANYYIALGSSLTSSRELARQEINRIEKQLGMINGVINTQQQYANKIFFMEDTTLNELVDDVCLMQEKSLQNHSVNLVKKFKPAPPVKIPRVKIAHVLTNLIKNAKEAMEDQPPEQRILTLEIDRMSESEVFVKVSDTGCGIQPENISRIFNHGFTTKSSGHGFGLHASANSMKEIGGRLQVDSPSEGKGTTFTLIFPVFKPIE